MPQPASISYGAGRDGDWLGRALRALDSAGYAVVEDVLEPAFIDACRTAMYRVQQAIAGDIGHDRLERAGEVGVLRLMLKYDPLFYRFLEMPSVLAVVDRTISETATMHLQNGLLLPSFAPDAQPSVFQNAWHQDFPRVLNGYLASINVLFAIDGFTSANGATWVVPASHQKAARPSDADIRATASPVECPAGSMVIFDSTLWHAAGRNTSGRDRAAINHQFTRSYIKQQIDYVRALGEPAIQAQPPRTQQLLGWYTRVVTSLDEYYQPPEKRLYRARQG